MSTPVTAAPESAARINIPKVRCARRRWRLHRRQPGQWIAPCRDEADRRQQVLVVLTDDGRVAVVVPHGNVAVLDLLMVGRLRAALRDAVFALEDLDAETPRVYSVSIASAS